MAKDKTPKIPDKDSLKDALGRTGRMLKVAGLPFEEDEFEDDQTEASTKESVKEADSDEATR